MTKNCWLSIDAEFNILSGQNLWPSIIVCIILWTYWLPFTKIETQPFGKAELSNDLVRVTLILPIWDILLNDSIRPP